MSVKQLNESPNSLRLSPVQTSGNHPPRRDVTSDVVFRHPLPSDGKAMWSLVCDNGGLDLNSPYAYLMACRNWPATCVLAEDADGPVGLVVAYRQATRPQALFVWQIGVALRRRGTGLGSDMLAWLIKQDGPAFLETTITPTNSASRALFAGFARRMGVGLTDCAWLNADDFPGQHEGEDLFTIGPFKTNKE